MTSGAEPTVVPSGILGESQPTTTGARKGARAFLADIGFALLLVFALPVVLVVAGTPVVLVARVIIAIGERIF